MRPRLTDLRARFVRLARATGARAARLLKTEQSDEQSTFVFIRLQTEMGRVELRSHLHTLVDQLVDRQDVAAIVAILRAGGAGLAPR